MADIELTINGDASGAEAALKSTGTATQDLAQDTGKAVVAWQLMAEVATKAASAVVKYGIDAVKAFAAAERIQAQLNRAAGEYGETLGKQAEAMSRLYAVDDDLIKQSYVLLTQWGGVGAATEETTKAVLNYATATGTDAVSATQALIRNVESGGVGMAKLGIHFKETGKKGNDLAAAVGAINEKFGGAASADAKTLSGSAHAAQLAVDDLQKSIGGMLGTMLDKSGAFAFITEKIRQFTKGAEVAFSVISQLRDIAGKVVRHEQLGAPGADLTNAAMSAVLGSGGPALELPAASSALTNKGRKDAPDVIAHGNSAEAHDVIYRHEEESAEHTYSKLEKMRLDFAKSSADGDEAEEKRRAEQDARIAKEAADTEKRALKDQADRVAKKTREAAQAGDAIGAAMVNALADQLSKLAEGGEFDAALFVGDIMAAAVGIAGTVIGTYLGAPAVGAAIGNLAATGIRLGASAISKSGKRKPRASAYHDGGEIEHWPRFHSGGGLGTDEVPIIAQKGEHMLSRRDVANMGGRSGVEAAKRGGITLNVSAIDAKSMADTFTGSGGDGLKQALRRGHGALPALLGRGPR